MSSKEGDWGNPREVPAPSSEYAPKEWTWTVMLWDSQTRTVYAVQDSDYSRDTASKVWWWTDGNGACDCNRALALGHGDIECDRYDPPRYWLRGIYNAGRPVWEGVEEAEGTP